MDLFNKYFNNAISFPLVSDHITHFLKFVNEKPVTSVLAPVTLTLLCYYVYIYVRKFFPICVNCWFCNSNFNVAFDDRFEFKCITCGQFNGFKKDGSYSKIIYEQHDHRYNKNIFNITQNSIKESKNGLCHKCNIIQEIKMKQLASFIPTKEKNFDKEIEKFQKHLEETLQLCSRCNLYTKKILALQDQRYNLKSMLMVNQIDVNNVSDWPNIFSLCLSFIVFILSSKTENYLDNWTTKFMDTLFFYDNRTAITISYLIGAVSFGGILCQVYQCLNTMDKLSAVIMLFWSLLFATNNFEILKHYKPKLFITIIIVILSTISILKNMTKKQKIRQISIKLEDENYQFPANNYNNISKNGSIKTSDESEMMDLEESPKKEKILNKTVDNMFQGMKLNDKHNVIRPSKLFMPAKHEKFAGYVASTPGFYTSFSMKDDYECDRQSMYSQHSYRTQCSPLYHQPISPYTYYSHPNLNHSNPLNSSHSSNSSNIQQISEWPKMLIYSIPGIILLVLQCYLLYDIKDFMKQK